MTAFPEIVSLLYKVPKLYRIRIKDFIIGGHTNTGKRGKAIGDKHIMMIIWYAHDCKHTYTCLGRLFLLL